MEEFSKLSDRSHWAHHYRLTDFEQSGESVQKQLAQYLETAWSREFDRVLPKGSPEERLAQWQTELEGPKDLSDTGLIRKDLIERMVDRSNKLHDPRYAGHQVAVPFPELAWLQATTSLLNNGMAIDEMGPASSPMEEAVMRSIAEFMGLGREANGVLCHGGTLANLTALLAARQRRYPGNAWRDGTSKPCALLVSDQAHYCVARAAQVMGWGDGGIFKVATNEQHQMDGKALLESYEEAKNWGFEVLAIVGSACTTSTGSFDDLEMMADFAAQHGMWFHVDGAHGAAQIFSKTHRTVLKGMERADSIAMDFHKMLGVPALCTWLFYRNGQDGYAAFSHEANYLYESQEEEWWNFSKRTFECTKRMLSAAVYGIWENHGANLWESLVDRLIENAQSFALKVDQRPRWELFSHPHSNIVCFRSMDFDNDALRRQMIDQGPYYLVKTVFGRQTWLRCTFQNPLTNDEDMKGLLEGLEEIGRSLTKA